MQCSIWVHAYLKVNSLKVLLKIMKANDLPEEVNCRGRCWKLIQKASGCPTVKEMIEQEESAVPVEMVDSCAPERGCRCCDWDCGCILFSK